MIPAEGSYRAAWTAGRQTKVAFVRGKQICVDTFCSWACWRARSLQSQTPPSHQPPFTAKEAELGKQLTPDLAGTIFLNHYNGDQSGGAAALKQKTGAAVMAGFAEVPCLEHGGSLPSGPPIPPVPGAGGAPAGQVVAGVNQYPRVKSRRTWLRVTACPPPVGFIPCATAERTTASLNSVVGNIPTILAGITISMRRPFGIPSKLSASKLSAKCAVGSARSGIRRKAAEAEGGEFRQ
jgi:hypothetical protein